MCLLFVYNFVWISGYKELEFFVGRFYFQSIPSISIILIDNSRKFIQ